MVTKSEFRAAPDDLDDDIVTGYRHLLGMGEFRGIPIITIVRMLDLLQS